MKIELRGQVASQKFGPAGFGSKEEKEQLSKKTNKQAETGHFLYQQGRLEEAVAIYESLIKWKAKSTLILGNLAAIYAQKGRYSEAEELLEEALSVDQGFSEGWATLGFVQKAQDNIHGAIRAYTISLSLAPDNCYCHYNLGNALSQVGRFNEAIEAYGQALALNSQFPEALTNLGWAFLEVGKYQEAASSCVDALSITPNHFAALNNLGKAQQALGDNRSAINTFKRAIACNATSPDPFFNLGSALKSINEIKDAADAYQEALRLKPEFAEAHLNLGALYAQLGRAPEAIACYERALIIKPQLVEALFNLAKAYATSNRQKEAIIAYNNILLISPKLAEAERQLSLLVDAKVDLAPMQRAQGCLTTTDDPGERAQLYFAIAKYKDDLDDNSAFDCYQKGNQEMNKTLLWERPNIQQLIATNAAVADTKSTWQDEHEPIFLVGIPCCGADLAQLVLSQNPKLGKLGKTEFLNIASNYILDSNINSMSKDVISSIKAIHRDFDLANPIDDHDLFGFQYCSAIASLFPRGKIIHCFRNPVDNLLAIYTTYLGTENPWAYDLDAIIEYYDFYRQIMAYHQASAPAGMIHLNMDEMRANPWMEIPNLIETCGFEWSECYLNTEILTQCDKAESSSASSGGLANKNRSSWLLWSQLIDTISKKLELKGYLASNWA